MISGNGSTRPSDIDSIAIDLLEGSCDLEGSFASCSQNDVNDDSEKQCDSQFEQEFFESILDPLEDEENDEGLPQGDEDGQSEEMTDPTQPRRSRRSSGPSGPSGRPILRSKSDHHRGVSRCSSGRAAPRRGLSASCSMMNFDGSFSNSGTQLSREKSKLCKLSSQSSHQRGDDDRVPARSVHRRRSSKSVISTVSNSSDDTSYDGNTSFAQLQVGDLVMLGSKETSTSLHLIRRMPRRRKSCDDLEYVESSSEELLEADMDALKA
jgi:hypothetical protein